MDGQFASLVVVCVAISFWEHAPREPFVQVLFGVGTSHALSIGVFDDIKIELEENIQSQKNEVYIFVNGTLLQSKLIEDNKAKVKLKSPAFKYDFDKKEEMVMSVVEEKENDTFSKSRRIAYLCIAFWCISFGFVIRKLVRKRI